MSAAILRRTAAAAGAEIVNDSLSTASASASNSLSNTASSLGLPAISDQPDSPNAFSSSLDLTNAPAPSLATTMTDDQIDAALSRHKHQPTMVGSAAVVPVGQDALTDNMERMRINEEAKRKAALASSTAAAAAASTSVATANTLANTQTTANNTTPPVKKIEKNAAISYAAERVIGSGSFGVVYQASIVETGEIVAIKKVLQDRRFKNRELAIMSSLDHPDVVQLKHCFYSKGEKPDEVYLNLVMEYIPETVHRTLRNHTKANKLIPITYVKVYMWQICRAVAYIHSQGVAHRDIKPQNLLMNPKTHQVKLCDFGSAKQLIAGEPNVAYICSRYYRAPELVFEATEYTTAIDIWSVGCVMAELMLGNPLFPGESGVDQLIEIIKVLGTPTKEEIYAMNPNHNSFKFPQIRPHPWPKVFRNKQPANAIDLVSRMLRYEPNTRIDPLDALTHNFFDELRTADVKLPNGKDMPALWDFTVDEVKAMQKRGIFERVVPSHLVQTVLDGAKPKAAH